VPGLESILAAALHRAALQSEVVETAALRRSDETKTAVLRSVSHDLRTPLTALLTAAAALDPDHGSPEHTRDIKEVLTASATRLWRLIEKLLDLSLLQAGTIEQRLDWYSIEEVLQEAIEQVDADRESFDLSLEPNMPLLRGDPGQLERGLANILENAARYSGGKPVSVRARTVGDRIRIRIVDQGPGISPSEQERIFMPFYRSRPSADRHQGSGLGLAIAKGFVELNSGRIQVESLPGQGTTFVVDFPILDQATARTAALAGTTET
jgi:two-component system sensor histidine kinase KdpD